ncbi:MAG: hypothetical protein JSW06_02325 [Thermoplasmatales archaeon]|nr:MAG: hypothetical protein JSW06_02325 [Thermoplasmatales archaeon]
MKEFEKWQQNLINLGLYSVAEDAESAWKAALEWVLSRVDHPNSDGSIIQDIKDESDGTT